MGLELVHWIVGGGVMVSLYFLDIANIEEIIETLY